jgi:hypothetical protein
MKKILMKVFFSCNKIGLKLHLKVHLSSYFVLYLLLENLLGFLINNLFLKDHIKIPLKEKQKSPQIIQKRPQNMPQGKSCQVWRFFFCIFGNIFILFEDFFVFFSGEKPWGRLCIV